MASVVLGSGENIIKVEGDALRFDQLVMKIDNVDNSKLFKVANEPKDDIRISEIPKAIREVSLMIKNLEMIKTDYKLPVNTFVSYKESIEAWSRVDYKEVLSEDSIIGYTLSENYVKLYGLIPLTEAFYKNSIVVNGWFIGKVLSENVGYLMPWAMKRFIDE